MVMNTERDKFLTEQMGLCYHEELICSHRNMEYYGSSATKYCCPDCQKIIFLDDNLNNRKYLIEYYEQYPTKTGRCKKCGGKSLYNIDFSTWEGFGKLWEWYWMGDDFDNFVRGIILKRYVNPNEFANLVYEELKDKTNEL